jgi:hypothetical protein
MLKIGLGLLILGFVWLIGLQASVLLGAGIRPVLAAQYKEIDSTPVRLYSRIEVEEKIRATARSAFDAGTPMFILPGALMLLGGILVALSKREGSLPDRGDA